MPYKPLHIIMPMGKERKSVLIKDGKCDALHDYLEQKGIGTVIHYPIAPHKQECYQHAEWNHSSLQGCEGGRLVLPITEHLADEKLSIPMSQCMTQVQVEWVVKRKNNL